MLRPCLSLGVLCALAACQPASQQPERDTTPVPTQRAVNESTIPYPFDVERSDIRILVYRAGALARFGHNHVISIPALAGQVNRHEVLERSTFALTFSVAELAIDDPALRQAEGENFTTVPSESDIDGTRRNMLSEALLDGSGFPAISVAGSNLAQSQDGWSIELRMQVKDNSFAKRVPVSLEVSDKEIVAASEFDLTHGELGLTPFSVMLGALQVADAMTVKVSLTATR